MSTRPVKLAYKAYTAAAPSAKAAGNIYIAHGLLGSAQNWTTPASHLARSPALAGKLNKVIAFDMRNHGASPHSADHSDSALASDLEAAVLEQQRELQRQFGTSDVAGGHAILMGHSMGGLAIMSSLLRRYNETLLLPEDPGDKADGLSKRFGPSWKAELRRNTSAAMRSTNELYDFAETQPIRDVLLHDTSLSMEDQAITSAIAPRVPKLGRVSAAVIVDITPSARLDPARTSVDNVRLMLGQMLAANLESIRSYDDATRELTRVGIVDKGLRDFVITNLKIDSTGRTPTSWRCNLDGLTKQYGRFLTSITKWFRDAAGAAGAEKEFVKPKPCTLPVLFVFGGNSEFNDETGRAQLAELFPNGKQLVVDGAGHFVHYEKPNEFLKCVTPFIAEHL